MISGTGFLAMLLLLSLLMAVGRYILEGSANRFVQGGPSLDSNREFPSDVVRIQGGDAGFRCAISTHDAPRCSGTVFEVPKPQG